MTTKIEWTDVTDNIIVAEQGGWWCRKISAGCQNCYAAKLNQSSYFHGNKLPYSGEPPALTLKRSLIASWQNQRTPKKHFVSSMTDVFGDWVAREWQYEMLAGMIAAPKQIFQVLTKRADVAYDFFMEVHNRKYLCTLAEGCEAETGHCAEKPPQHIWLGFTAENQACFDERWQYMKKLAALGWIVFASCEPLLGPITLPADFLALGRRTQVITGGESGPNARPSHPDWFRSLRDQCQAAGVAFFFKQFGAWAPIPEPFRYSPAIGSGNREYNIALRRFAQSHGASRLIADHADGWSPAMIEQGQAIINNDFALGLVGKKAAGRTLDGQIWSEFPSTTKEPI
jgi:protein gp37